MFLFSPMVWKIDLESSKLGIWRLNINTNKHLVHDWVYYNTKEIILRKKGDGAFTNLSSWNVQVIPSDGSTDSRKNKAIALSSMLWMIPGSDHSWVHFPYSDFACYWLEQNVQKQKTKSLLHEILRVHTLQTKWNTTLVKVLKHSTHSANNMTDVSDDVMSDNLSSDSSAFPVPQHSTLSIIFEEVRLHHHNPIHPLIHEMSQNTRSILHSHPIMKLHYRAYIATWNFVTSIEKYVNRDLDSFVEMIYRKTSGRENIDMRYQKLELFTRILWSAAWVHTIDHNCFTLSYLPNEFNISPIMIENLKKGNAHRSKDAIFNTIVRFPNFMRTFADYNINSTSPTVISFEYNGNIVKQQNNYKKQLQNCLIDYNILVDKLGLTKYLTFGKFRAEDFPVTINH